MAKFFHRKLFFNQTSNPTNDTYRCTDFCDPTCGNLEECYTFPGPVEPLPPLPPPVPPISIVVSPSTTNQGIIQVSPFVIIVVIILASIFLLVSYYAVVIRYCTFWNRFIIRRDHDASTQSAQVDRHATDALIREDDDQDPVIDHPIWLISTIGLHQSVINSITMVKYKSEDGLIDGTDCSVCLSEFQEGETLRLLPKCKHAFHIDCIDTWLRSHTNCPLCRAAIMANSARQSLASNNPSFGHSRRVDLGQIPDSDSSDIELENIRIGDSGRVVEIRGDDNVDRNDQNKADNEYNIIRRSFSMDHFRGWNSRNVGDSILLRNSSNSNPTRVMDSSSSSSGPQPPRSVPLMKRSYSWSERVFWSSSNQNSCNRNIYP